MRTQSLRVKGRERLFVYVIGGRGTLRVPRRRGMRYDRPDGNATAMRAGIQAIRGGQQDHPRGLDGQKELCLANIPDPANWVRQDLARERSRARLSAAQRGIACVQRVARDERNRKGGWLSRRTRKRVAKRKAILLAAKHEYHLRVANARTREARLVKAWRQAGAPVVSRRISASALEGEQVPMLSSACASPYFSRR